MTWMQRYHLRRTFRRSLWMLPALSVGIVIAAAPFVRSLDRTMGWTGFHYTPDGARAILGAFTSSMLTFVVFVLSSLLIVVQLASAQMTPRIIATVFAEWRLKWVLTIFTFSYTFTISASGRVDDDGVPQSMVAVAIGLNLMSIALFFWFVQWLGGSLRPIAVLQGVADEGRAVVEGVYSEPFDPAREPQGGSPDPEVEAKVIEHVGPSGVVLAFAPDELAAMAERADAVIELVPQVGDFVARGDPFFRIHGGGPIEADALRARVAIGAERTMEQDPRFAFRIMVDIANKALSPAINDPTTAVLALDQIHKLLMHVGQRRLDAGAVRDAKGRLRLCYGTPDWPDFVSLAVTEIRQFGASSMQVARRLQAMLAHLLRVLPEARRPALRRELDLLQSAIERGFPDPEDRAHARIADLQGIGSSE